jgi:poly(3-hydroxybutyrate) depolymerase
VGVHSGLATGAAHSAQTAFSAMSGGAAPQTLHKARASAPGGAPAAPLVPTIVFHGDQDTTVHPLNGEQMVAPFAGQQAPQQPQQHKARSDNGRSFTRHTYLNPQGAAVAEHWVVHGAGHAWSGGSAAGSYTDATGPDATGEMLRFFLAHPRAGQR